MIFAEREVLRSTLSTSNLQKAERRGKPLTSESARRGIWVLRAIYSTTCPQNFTISHVLQDYEWLRHSYGQEVPSLSRQDAYYYVRKLQRGELGSLFEAPRQAGRGTKLAQVYYKRSPSLEFISLLCSREREREMGVVTYLKELKKKLASMPLPPKFPEPLSSSEQGARYFEANNHQIGDKWVTTMQFLNPPGRATLMSGEYYEEVHEEPLDEILLDDYLRDLIYCYAADHNTGHGKCMIDPKRLLNGRLRPSEIREILRLSDFAPPKQSKAVLVFTIHLIQLRSFLETKKGVERLTAALRRGSREYKDDVIHIRRYYNQGPRTTNPTAT